MGAVSEALAPNNEQGQPRPHGTQSAPSDTRPKQDDNTAPCSGQHRRLLAKGAYLISNSTIALWPGMCQLRSDYADLRDKRRGGGLRGFVQHFTHASRHRLYRALCQVDPRSYQAPLWCNLTFHNLETCPYDRAFDALDRWLTHFRRMVPAGAYLWRAEMQQRGVAHFHAMLWLPARAGAPTASTVIPAMRQTWHQLVAPHDVHHAAHGAKIEAVQSFRKARHYLSKYVTKEDQTLDTSYRGRRWGRSQTLRTQPVLTIELTAHMDRVIRRLARRYLRKHCKDPLWAENYITLSPTWFLFVPVRVAAEWLLSYFEHHGASTELVGYYQILDVLQECEGWA